jgi:hypothetical protein
MNFRTNSIHHGGCTLKNAFKRMSTEVCTIVLSSMSISEYVSSLIPNSWDIFSRLSRSKQARLSVERQHLPIFPLVLERNPQSSVSWRESPRAHMQHSQVVPCLTVVRVCLNTARECMRGLHVAAPSLELAEAKREPGLGVEGILLEGQFEVVCCGSMVAATERRPCEGSLTGRIQNESTFGQRRPTTCHWQN